MKLKLSALTDTMTRKLSKGEVTTYGVYDNHFQTPQPVAGGVFCMKIFGPVKDYVCGCGQRRHPKAVPDGKCVECGVPILPAKVRASRYGHIETNLPYISPMVQPLAAELLGVSRRDFPKFLIGKFKFKLVQHPMGILPAKDGKFYNMELHDIKKGEEVLEEDISLLSLLYAMDKVDIDYDRVGENHHCIMKKGSSYKSIKDLINFTLLVSPPAMREAGSFMGRVVYPPVNVFYLRALRISTRAQALIDSEHEMLDQLLPRETTLLQSIINKLMIEGAEDRMGNPLQSIIKNLDGKQGRIRGNLLGKRVDFSGRSVISSAPHLPLDTIGVPFKMMYELLKPELLGELERMVEHHGGEVNSYKRALHLYMKQDKLALDLCWQLIDKAIVLDNRAPSLHRYSVQGFKVRAHQGKHLEFPNMVMNGFNADADGDTTAIHLVISEQAKKEVRERLMVTNCLMSSASWDDPVVAPSHETLCGLFAASRL